MSDTPKSAAQRVEEAVGFRVDEHGWAYPFHSWPNGSNEERQRYINNSLWNHCISECERADRAEAELARLRSILIDSGLVEAAEEAKTLLSRAGDDDLGDGLDASGQLKHRVAHKLESALAAYHQPTEKERGK